MVERAAACVDVEMASVEPVQLPGCKGGGGNTVSPNDCTGGQGAGVGG